MNRAKFSLAHFAVAEVLMVENGSNSSAASMVIKTADERVNGTKSEATHVGENEELLSSMIFFPTCCALFFYYHNSNYF